MSDNSEATYYGKRERTVTERDRERDLLGDHDFSWVGWLLTLIVFILFMVNLVSAGLRHDEVAYSDPKTTSYEVKGVSTDGRSWMIVYLDGNTVKTESFDKSQVIVENTEGEQSFERITFTRTTTAANRDMVIVSVLTWVLRESFYGDDAKEDEPRKTVDYGIENTDKQQHVLKIDASLIEKG